MKAFLISFFWYFTQVSLYPMAAVVVCGFFLWACKRLFLKLLGRGGYNIIRFTSIIGTPIHELGHAAMCVLFGHKIEKMVLWQPRAEDGSCGYVRHTFNPRSLYQKLGSLFISAGPIFSGMAAMSILLAVFFPRTWELYVAAVGTVAQSHAPVRDLIATGLDILSNLYAECRSGSGNLWVQIPMVLVMLMISLHIDLSPDDMRNMLKAVPVYLFLTLLIALVTILPGAAVTGAVLTALEAFNAFMMAMFTVVLTFSVAQAALALVIRSLRSLIGK